MSDKTLRVAILSFILVVELRFIASAEPPAKGQVGEPLYNGIRLPARWPPRIERLSRQPMRVPYLEQPPEVILIDVGRRRMPGGRRQALLLR